MIGDDLRLPIFDPEAIKAETSAMIYQVMGKGRFLPLLNRGSGELLLMMQKPMEHFNFVG